MVGKSGKLEKKCDMHAHIGSLETILDGSRRKGTFNEPVTDFFVNSIRKLAG